MRLAEVENIISSENIEWVEMPLSSFPLMKYKPNEVYVKISKKPGCKSPLVDIRIGMDICRELDFKPKDRLMISYSKTNSMILKIEKASIGIKIQAINSQTSMSLRFSNTLLIDGEGKKPFRLVKHHNVDFRNKALIVHL